jgi:FHS family L-fucose permease-like MFS transporter
MMNLQPPNPRGDLGRMTVSLVTFLFFTRGFCTVLTETMVPKLKGVFELTYTEVMLTQFCFYFGYFIFSVPAAHILARVGYARAIVFGSCIMIMGCLTFTPAAYLGRYPVFLMALFVLAAGVTLLQVVTNPLISILGPARSSHSRLNLAQAFNSLGTTLAPLAGAWLFLGPAAQPASTGTFGIRSAAPNAEVHALQLPFLVIAGVVGIVALIFWFGRKRPVLAVNAIRPNLAFGFRLLKGPPFLFGVISIFVYVGAEVSIGSLIINYLTQRSVLAVTAARAGELAALYWGAAMCGRFIGSAALRVVPPGIALSVCGALAGLLAIISLCTTGTPAAVAIISIGLFNSIMFPTIFALALDDLGEDKPEGSGMLCMAIVGGAIMPLVTGIVADSHGLALSLAVPAACYSWIAFYGTYMGFNFIRESDIQPVG